MPAASINATAHLLVLDSDHGRGHELAESLSRAGYECVTVVTDASDLPLAMPSVPELILADLDAPGARDIFSAIGGAPVLGLTGDGSPVGRNRAATLGADDFAVRPIDGDELRMRVDNVLGSSRLRRLLHDRSARLTEALRDHSVEVDTVRESLTVLAAVADFHDDDTDHHADRVGILSGAIARALRQPADFVAMLTQAAPLHDIGKVGISRRILLKPGSLTAPERVHMMQHVDVGGQILATAQSPVLVLAAEIARTHHERWDGSGYTAGLSGEQIPLSGRIVAIADVWDTLTHDRPYRAAWTQDRALTEIYDQAGRHFDPDVVEAFASLEQAMLTPSDARVA